MASMKAPSVICPPTIRSRYLFASASPRGRDDALRRRSVVMLVHLFHRNERHVVNPDLVDGPVRAAQPDRTLPGTAALQGLVMIARHLPHLLESAHRDVVNPGAKLDRDVTWNGHQIPLGAPAQADPCDHAKNCTPSRCTGKEEGACRAGILGGDEWARQASTRAAARGGFASARGTHGPGRVSRETAS